MAVSHDTEGLVAQFFVFYNDNGVAWGLGSLEDAPGIDI